MNAVVAMPQPANVDAYRASTDAASLCKDIVVASASTIQGRKFVAVEGWMAIAIAHGCAASARDVEKVDGGVRAIGEVRRMSDGVVIATGEGFVGEDEPTWYGGLSRGKTLPKRADYAIRAMAQTRAISRACRSAFAHVVVMMNAGLSTTPAEEVPDGGFDDGPRQQPATVTPMKKVEPSRRVAADGAGGTITGEQLDMLKPLVSAAGMTPRAVADRVGVAQVIQMPAELYDATVDWLRGLIAEKSGKPAAKPAPQSSELLDDDIPY